MVVPHRRRSAMERDAMTPEEERARQLAKLTEVVRLLKAKKPALAYALFKTTDCGSRRGEYIIECEECPAEDICVAIMEAEG